MNVITSDYSHAGVDEKKIIELGKSLIPEIERIQQAKNLMYETEYAFMNVIEDSDLIEKIKKITYEKRKLKPSLLLVIGIGGSNLGTLAIEQALYGLFYNDYNHELKIYFVDTVDSDYTNDIFLLVEQALEKSETVLMNIVSKSGSTTESIANFEIFLNLFKHYYQDEYYNYVVITTDQGSRLWEVAQKEKFDCLIIPKNIGGRYSVFSSVGLFPLAMLGVDIHELHKGASEVIPSLLDTDIYSNIAALGAAHIFAHYQNNIIVHNLFIFSVDLQGVGAWYRQLMAESLGKSKLRSGEKHAVGILPTTSIGSTDLHSMVQFYLAGPSITYTTFLSVDKNKSDLITPKIEPFEKVVANIQNKELSSIMSAILDGTTQAYAARNRPFCTINIQEKSAYCLGQLLQYKMLEIVYLAFLLNVNPFDQPEVELYKEKTRKILANE